MNSNTRECCEKCRIVNAGINCCLGDCPCHGVHTNHNIDGTSTEDCEKCHQRTVKECDCHLRKEQVCDICACRHTPTTEEDIIAELERYVETNWQEMSGPFLCDAEPARWLRTALHRHRISVIEEALRKIPTIKVGEGHDTEEANFVNGFATALGQIRTTLQDMKDKKEAA